MLLRGLVVLGRGGIAGAALLGVTVAFLGGASPLLLGAMWAAGIVFERLANGLAALLGGTR